MSPISRKVREQTGRDTLHRNATQRTAMPPKRELSIRLRAELREALDAAVAERGQTLTAIVEDALAQFLGVDGPEPGQATLADRVRALEERVGLLEGTAMQRNATQDSATQRRPTPPNTTPATAPTTGAYQADGVGDTALLPGAGEGITHIGAAVIEAGLCSVVWPKNKPITERHCKGSNLNEMLKARTGGGAAEWLASQGWKKVDGKWYPPDP